MSSIDSCDHQHCIPPQPEFSAEDRTSQDDSNSTNGFASLDRAADRFQSSGFNRQLPLMILNRI
eukprot:5478446-Pyramimonas_sp.AAC.1